MNVLILDRRLDPAKNSNGEIEKRQEWISDVFHRLIEGEYSIKRTYSLHQLEEEPPHSLENYQAIIAHPYARDYRSLFRVAKSNPLLKVIMYGDYTFEDQIDAEEYSPNITLLLEGVWSDELLEILEK